MPFAISIFGRAVLQMSECLYVGNEIRDKWNKYPFVALFERQHAAAILLFPSWRIVLITNESSRKLLRDEKH